MYSALIVAGNIGLSFAVLGGLALLLIWIRVLNDSWRHDLCFAGRPDDIDQRPRRAVVLALRIGALFVAAGALYVVWM